MGIYDDLLPEEERKRRGIILNNVNTGSRDGKYGIYSDLVTGKSPSQVASDQQKEQQGKKPSLIQKVKESVTNLFSKKKDQQDIQNPNQTTPVAGPAPTQAPENIIEPMKSSTPSLFDSIPSMPTAVQNDWSLKNEERMKRIKDGTATPAEVVGAFLNKSVDVIIGQEYDAQGKKIAPKKVVGSFLEDAMNAMAIGGFGGPQVAGIASDAITGVNKVIDPTIKYGFSLVRGLKTGTTFTAIGSLVSALQEKDITVKDSLTSFGLGLILGLHGPVEMKGVATEDLTASKALLKDYGITSADLKNPEVLKTKWRENMMNLHPDKGGNAQEFQAFTDAYNKVTSAGVNSKWSMPDINEWFNHLWDKNGMSEKEATAKAEKQFKIAIAEKASTNATSSVPSNVMTPEQALVQVEGSNLKGTPAGNKISEVIIQAKESGKNIRFNVTGSGEVSVVTPAGTRLGMDVVDTQIPQYSVSNQDGTPATPTETSNKSLPELKSAIDNYKSDQGVTIMPNKTVEVSPALKELSLLSERPDVVSITQNQVKAIPTNEDGTVTLYRVGTPRIGDNRLVSATYTKEAAVAFNEMHKKDMGDRPITEIKVKPEDIKVFVGGGEQEVLINNPHSSSIVSVTKVSDGTTPIVEVGPNDVAIPAVDEPKIAEALRSSKGLSAEDIIKKHPDINLKRDVVITDIHGNKMTIDKGEALTPYEMKGGKVVLQDGQTYVVSKNQFQNVKGNAISGEAKEFAPELKKTEETVKGNPIADKKLKELGYEVEKDMDGSVSILYKGEEVEFADLPVNVQELLSKNMEDNPVKYGNYVLPGGENYREILIKAPVPEDTANKLMQDFVKMVKEKYLVTNPFDALDKGLLTKAEADELNRITKMPNTRPNTFKSSHWNEPNVISHIRINERTYQDKPVTFVEEIQSDWAREGRSKGFSSQVKIDWKPSNNGDLNATYKGKDLTITREGSKFYVYEKGGLLGQTQPTIEDAKRVAQNYVGFGIPDNELLKNWQEMSIKRSLLEAVKNKSEYMAWISGEQTSARYNLSTVVDEVIWNPSQVGGKTIKLSPKAGSKEIGITIDKDGVITGSSEGTWKDKKLDEVIGKGLADKIMANETGKLSGEGLKFGGEWAINLYDKQFKSIVENLTGGKVETIDMKLPIDNKTPLFTIGEGRDVGGSVTPRDLKKGLEITDELGTYWKITDVLGDGKFKAVTKKDYLQHLELIKQGKEDSQYYNNVLNRSFDISTKLSTGQQSIKLTPEIVARIKSEAPALKSPSGKDPFAKPVVPEPVRIDRTKLVGRDLSKPNAVLLAERGIVKPKEAPKLDKVALAAANKKLGDYYNQYGNEHPDELGQAWYEVMAEMEVAEPGQRIFDDYGEFKGSISSTFPDFVPEELRRTDLFNSVLDGVKDPTNMVYPPSSQPRKQALYDTILAEIDSRAGSDSSAIINEIKGIYEKAKAKPEEVISGSPAGSQPEQATAQKVTTTASDTAKKSEVPISRLQERIQEQLLEIDPNRYEFEPGSGTYNKLNLEADAQQAAYFMQTNPKEALNIALGYADAPVGQTANAISLAVAFKARAEGNMELWKDIIIKTSLRNTKFGQEIVSLRGHFNNDTPENYIKKVLDARMDILGKSMITDAQKVVGINKKRSNKVNAIEKIDRETDKLVEKVNEPIKKKKVADRIKMAQDIIDSLICK